MGSALSLLPLLALLACGWTECRRDDVTKLHTMAPTPEHCAGVARLWAEGPFERKVDAGYVYGASCDAIGGMSSEAVTGPARAWCAALAGYKARCRAAGYMTGGIQ